MPHAYVIGVCRGCGTGPCVLHLRDPEDYEFWGGHWCNACSDWVEVDEERMYLNARLRTVDSSAGWNNPLCGLFWKDHPLHCLGLKIIEFWIWDHLEDWTPSTSTWENRSEVSDESYGQQLNLSGTPAAYGSDAWFSQWGITRPA
jgi:hypothetical protein